jgi:hypothetical protein
MRRSRKALAVVALGALAVLTAACGGGTGDGAASVSAEEIQLAASNSSEAESYRFTTTIGFSIEGEGVEMRMDGIASADGTRAAITAEIPEVGSFEERIVDGIVYLDFGSLPEAAAALPPGKRWVAIDPATVGGIDEEQLRALTEQTEQNTPSRGLESLRGLTGDVEDLGQETVGGRTVTHYRGELDHGALADELGEAEPASRDTFEALAEGGPVPVDVWIDEQDRVVKLQMTMPFPAVAGAGGGSIEMTMEITEFGVPVDVQAPPPEEVVPIGELTDTGII